MALSSKTAELLSGFQKRMQFINIARCILSYPYNKDCIKDMNLDKEILDNLVVAVLVFIKEQTLCNEKNCSMMDIEEFLDDLSSVLPPDSHVDIPALARFIVVDALQNGGILASYKVLSVDTCSFESMAVRLLEEERGTYHLTDEAFDFLFRSKEIESELDYSVTRFKMAEYMKRDNYTEALDESRELVSKIRNMKVSMDDFLRSCRENISKIAVDQYENIVSRTRNLLNTEYKELEDIQENARNRSIRLRDAAQSGVNSDEVIKHRKALDEISDNIQIAIDEQRSLINKRMSLSDEYYNIVSDSYAITRYERMNFNTDIMANLRNGAIPLDRAAEYLLAPFSKPEFMQFFSVENFYAIQSRITQSQEEDEIIGDIVEQPDFAEQRNALFLDICTELFRYMVKRQSFKVSEFVAALDDERLYEFCDGNALPQMILALYALQTVSISGWKHSNEMIVRPMGEFELSWCLSEMPGELTAIDSFTVTKLDREFSFTICTDNRHSNISMSDFVIEVN